MESPQDVTPGVNNGIISSPKYYYPTLSFSLTGLAWIGLIIALALQSDTGLIFGYMALALLVLSSLVSLMGFFKTRERRQRWLCIIGACLSISPFLFYFFFIHIVLPFVLSGITGPN